MTSKALIIGAAAVLAIVAGTRPANSADKKATAPAAAATGPAAFTDSSAAGLSTTKRVAITNVMITFQASTGAEAGPSGWFRVLQSKSTSETVLGWPDFDANEQKTIADAAYAQLKADLIAAGFEVVPEQQVKASAHYQAILKQAAIPNPTQYANKLGDAYYAGPTTLTPYMPYNVESGFFMTEPTSYLGFYSKLGLKSKTPGGPSGFSLGNNWKLPGLENQLAKELNAHIVKANYVVTLGTASAKRSRAFTPFNSQIITGTASAYAEPGLLPQQTHISFRTPNGSPKWQKAPLTKLAPPKDGDVSVHLVENIAGGTDFFSLSSDGGKRKDGFLSQEGPKFKFMYTATLQDPKGYRAEVGGMIKAANGYMLALIRQ